MAGLGIYTRQGSLNTNSPMRFFWFGCPAEAHPNPPKPYSQTLGTVAEGDGKEASGLAANISKEPSK